MHYNLKGLFCVGLAGVGITMAAPAFSQSSVEEITVTGSVQNLPRVSRAVSYVDLDLTTPAGQNELKSRVKSTAKDLCAQLGESHREATPLVPTCEKDAWNTAQKQLNAAIASGYKPAPPPVQAAAPAYTPPAPTYAAPDTTAPKAARN
jgi:UrcA family protein